MKISAVLGLLASLALTGGMAAASTPALAGEAVPAAIARHLDEQPAEFTASAAKMRRMAIIQHNLNRQNHYGNRGYGRGPGYGPRPGYGYGPRPGYGSHRGHYGRRRY
jgi:hypothetical protein